MSFASDFFGGIAEASGLNARSAAVGDAKGASTGTKAGSAFFSIVKEYAQGTNVKQKIIDRVAQTPTAQQYANEQRSAYIQNLIRNPMLWIAVGAGVLIIGYFGYAWGKR